MKLVSIYVTEGSDFAWGILYLSFFLIPKLVTRTMFGFQLFSYLNIRKVLQNIKSPDKFELRLQKLTIIWNYLDFTTYGYACNCNYPQLYVGCEVLLGFAHPWVYQLFLRCCRRLLTDLRPAALLCSIFCRMIYVVSTLISGVLFARFSTVKRIRTI